MLYLANASSLPVRRAMVGGEVGMITTPNERRDPGRVHVVAAKDCDAIRGQRCPHDAHHAPVQVWAADNSVYGGNYPGDAAWLAWLARHAEHAPRALFATAPDVVGDAAATLARSAPFLPIIRELGYPAALVGQDGLEHLDVPWDTFDVLFLGGTTEWKLSPAAAQLARAATARGKRVHRGRVNSGRRWCIAEGIGCDTADGTFLAFGPDQNLERMRAWRRKDTAA